MTLNEMEAEVQESEAKRIDQCMDQLNKLPDKDTPRTKDTRLDILGEMARVLPSKINKINPELLLGPTDI